MNQNEKIYAVALSKLHLVGPVTARNLVSCLGSPAAVFEGPLSRWLQVPGIGPGLIRAVDLPDALRAAEAELQFAERMGYQVISYLDKAYPYRLRHRRDSPLVLYFDGAGDLHHHRMLSIVGTRSPSHSGIATCRQILEELRDHQLTVISGLALGIDIVVHKTCLELGIPTIAVMGTGMDSIYPAAHKRVAAEMRRQGGLLTEFGVGTKADKVNFPMRNRIIAGLCDALLVIESKEKGGSMITAELANGYDKDVFAVPGRPMDANAKGPHALIKQHKACLADCGADIAEAMNWSAESTPDAIQTSLFTELTDAETPIAEVLRSTETASVDLFYQGWHGTPGELAAVLLGMELKGLIRQLPGKQYEWLA